MIARRSLVASLALLALASCSKMRVVDPGVPTAPRVKDEDDVILYTKETGPPGIAYHENGKLEARTFLDFKTQSPRDNGFDHLRTLREAAFERGCHAVVVAEPEKEFNVFWCEDVVNPNQRPCLLVYRASCIVFD